MENSTQNIIRGLHEAQNRLYAEAWNHLVNVPDKLIEVLIEKVRELSEGDEPNEEKARQFLSANRERITITFEDDDPAIEDDEIDKKTVTFEGKTYKVIDGDWAHKIVRAFRFKGKTHKAEDCTDFYVKFLEILSKDNTLQFGEVEKLSTVFKKNCDDFGHNATPKKIGKTDIWVDTHYGNTRTKAIIEKIVKRFGRDMPIPLEAAD